MEGKQGQQAKIILLKAGAGAEAGLPTISHPILPMTILSLQHTSCRALQTTMAAMVAMGETADQQLHQATLHLIRWLLFGTAAALAVAVQVPEIAQQLALVQLAPSAPPAAS